MMEYNITFAVWGYYKITLDAESFDSYEEAEEKAMSLMIEIDCGDLYDVDSDVIDSEIINGRVNEKEIDDVL